MVGAPRAVKSCPGRPGSCGITARRNVVRVENRLHLGGDGQVDDGQPVVMGGPFVMNSKAEIAQAFRDFHSGKFGDIARQARLQ
jgi:Pirin C-terminal cupin domain